MAVTAGPKPVSADTKRRYLIQRAGYVLLAAAALVVVVPILYVIGMVVVQGIAAINWQFIFGMPSNGMKSGGIWPAIVGTTHPDVHHRRDLDPARRRRGDLSLRISRGTPN